MCSLHATIQPTLADSGSAHVSRLGLVPGVLIASKYELVGLLGCGAMGEVWRARHVSLHEDVAVKLVGWTDDHRDGAELASRFHLEARLAAGLSRKSRHIVSVTDHGIEQHDTGEALAYLVMEALVGEPLDVRLERVGPMALPDVVAIVTQIARGLSVAHAEGVIHRDLKPGNVFLARGADGEPEQAKILDFGIAKFRAGDDRRAQAIHHKTQRGLLLGTLPYVSPEQARGWASLDHRADVWSLAVITYLLLTNEYPFTGATPSDMLARIFSGEYVPVHERRRDVPPMFADLFARAFHRHLDMRFQSAMDFANALALAADAGLASPMPAASGELDRAAPIGPSRARPPRTRWVAVVALALLAAGTSAALLRAPTPPEDERAQLRVDQRPSVSLPEPAPAPAPPTLPPTTSSSEAGVEPVSEHPVLNPAASASVIRRPRRAAPAPRSKRGERSEIF